MKDTLFYQFKINTLQKGSIGIFLYLYYNIFEKPLIMKKKTI